MNLQPSVGLGDGLVELGLKEDVGLGYVGVKQRDGRLVVLVPRDGSDDLEHRRDARSSSNHRQMLRESVAVDKVSLGPFDLELVADLHLSNDLRDVSKLVRLNKKVKVALVLVGRGGRVGPSEGLAGGSDEGLNLDVLADGQAEGVGRLWEGEPVAERPNRKVSASERDPRQREQEGYGHGRIVVDDNLLGQGKVEPGRAVEDRLGRLLAVEEPERED